jgi:hypothetical protein
MKQQKNQSGYMSPQTELIDIAPMSVLCGSGDDGNRFSTSLEDMTENDYTFSF